MGRLPLTISPESFRGEAVGRFRVRRAVFFGIVVFALSSRSVLDVCKREGFARGEPWFYLRLGSKAGLTLFRVLREGLRLHECLGVTASRANAADETVSRTLVPDPGAAGENNAPRRHLVAPGISALASSVWLDRSVLLSSRVGG